MTRDTPRAFTSLISRVADHLGLRVVRPLAGGEFGALLVTGNDRAELVLKAIPSPEFGELFARGAAMAERMRAVGHPSPKYRGTGVALNATWSLQEHLPGAVPDVMTAAHADRLLELVAMHAGAAGRHARWQEGALSRRRARLAEFAGHTALAPTARELGAVLERCGDIALLDDGVVHNDFHQRNYLADGDEVTGVFDWEFASVGDWRFDLVTLAFWAVLLPEQIPPPIASTIVERLFAVCPPDVLALFAAFRTIDQLEFDARVHPERLGGMLPGINSLIAPWWRPAL
jgi:aminoglycoside phosphotransferase (APT) family kinase protein